MVDRTTPFLVCVWPMFHNYSAAHSAVRHWAKQFNKLHQRLANVQNRLDTCSLMVIVSSSLCITFGIFKTIRRIVDWFRHCAAKFVFGQNSSLIRHGRWTFGIIDLQCAKLTIRSCSALWKLVSCPIFDQKWTNDGHIFSYLRKSQDCMHPAFFRTTGFTDYHDQ